MHIIFFEVNS